MFNKKIVFGLFCIFYKEFKMFENAYFEIYLKMNLRIHFFNVLDKNLNISLKRYFVYCMKYV